MMVIQRGSTPILRLHLLAMDLLHPILLVAEQPGPDGKENLLQERREGGP